MINGADEIELGLELSGTFEFLILKRVSNAQKFAGGDCERRKNSREYFDDFRHVM